MEGVAGLMQVRYTRIVAIMWNRARRLLLTGCAVALVGGVVMATDGVSVDLAFDDAHDRALGRPPGRTLANLGIDVSFSPSSGDSPKDLTVVLPPGLLANSAIDGGACLSSTSTAPVAACQIGDRHRDRLRGLGSCRSPGSSVTLDLVAPPKPGDLAGVAIFLTLLGNASEARQSGRNIILRSVPAAPREVGLDIAFADIPDTFEELRSPSMSSTTSFSGPAPAHQLSVDRKRRA